MNSLLNIEISFLTVYFHTENSISVNTFVPIQLYIPRFGFCMHRETLITKPKLTEYNLHWDQLFYRSVRDSSSGRIAGRKSCKRATSTCQHWSTSQRRGVTRRTPLEEEKREKRKSTKAQRWGQGCNTFMPSSHEIQRSPRVRKQATACLAKWWIQPSSRSCVIIASIQGKPVCP